jgi:hypothetical protein
MRLEAMGGQPFPGFLGRIDNAEQVEVARPDHAMRHQRVEIDHLAPIVAAEQYHRDGRRLAGLQQGQDLELRIRQETII